MNLAIIGATGNVGRKTIEILEKSKIKISKLFLVASEKSEGKKIRFKGNEIQIQSLEKESISLDKAVEKTLEDGLRTPDIMSKGKKKVSTSDMGDAIVSNLN